MFDKCMSCFTVNMEKITSIIENKAYFLCLLGSIFLVGIVSKCLVMWIFGKMIKNAENMYSPKSNILRQIKLKFESIKTINGTVANPMLLVSRYINKCKIGIFYLDSINKIISWCGFLCVAIGGLCGYILYNQGYGKTTAMSYILVGFYFALALFVVENTIHTNDRKTELIYVITDFFENSVNLREQISRRENDYNIEIGSSKNEQESEQNVNVNEINNTNKKIENEKQGRINITKEQERIINEVLGEYLQ